MSADIATCPRCYGYAVRGRTNPTACPDCNGTGQRHTVADCTECGVSLLVPWGVDHTLAPITCASCAAVVNRHETARVTGERGR